MIFADYPPITVLVVDNHAAIQRSVAAVLREPPADFEVVGLAHGIDDVDFSRPPPDLVVLDLYLGSDDTLSTPSIARFTRRGSRVLVYTSETRPVPLREAVAAGAGGVALKDDDLDDLRRAAFDCALGDFACSSDTATALVLDRQLVAALSDREVAVLSGVADGLGHRQIATRLGISVQTARDYLKSARAKYVDLGRDVTNTISVAREATRDGWLDVPR